MSKKLPIVRNEVKAFMQGQHKLCKQLNLDNASTLMHARRSTKRMMSDLHGRGVVRMAVEATQLLTRRKKHDVTAAESIKSHLLTPFPCSQYLACQRAAEGEDIRAPTVFEPLDIDRRNPSRRKVVTNKNVGYKYGYRGMHHAVQHLSPYEFDIEWELQRVTYPTQAAQRFNQAQYNQDAKLMESPYHAYLTTSGKDKLRRKKELLPNVDYCIHGDEGMTKGRTWIAFPASATTLRNEWVMVRRLKPAVPRFQGPPLLNGGTPEDHARHMSVYFRPWVLDEAHSTKHVPHAGALRSEGQSWLKTWQQWCDGHVHNERSKWYITNFQAAFSMRQEEDVPDADGKRDSSITLRPEECKTALQTSMRQHKNDSGEMQNDASAEASFKLVKEMWGDVCSNVHDKAKHMKGTFKRPDAANVDEVLKATRASQKNDQTKVPVDPVLFLPLNPELERDPNSTEEDAHY